jgi:hypothetical protein
MKFKCWVEKINISIWKNRLGEGCSGQPWRSKWMPLESSPFTQGEQTATARFGTNPSPVPFQRAGKVRYLSIGPSRKELTEGHIYWLSLDGGGGRTEGGWQCIARLTLTLNYPHEPQVL